MSTGQRRMTLGAISAGQANARASTGRARVAKPRAGSTGRARAMSVGGARASSIGGRSSVGRSSVGGRSRRSSMFGASAKKTQDPRPLTDKAFINQCVRTLIHYLTEHGYDHAISPKTLTSPTSKDFLHIIQFLASKVDPGFTFSAKYEEEVAMLFKKLKYPFNISKSALCAVGSPHTWPALLAALTWLVELLTYEEEAEAKGSSDLLEGDNSEKLFFDYLSKAYQTFLSGEDNFDELEEDLAQSFDTRNAAVKEENDRLEAENEQLKEELSKLESEPSPLSVLQKKRADYASDIEKFQKLISNLEAHKSAMEKKLAERTTELAEREADLANAEAEKKMLEERVELQELSPADVQRMNAERTSLEKSVADIRATRESVEKELWELENELSKATDNVRKLVDSFNETARLLRMAPSGAENAKEGSSEITLSTDPEISIAPSIQDTLRPRLSALREKVTAQMHEAQEKLLSLREHSDQFEESLQEKRDEIAAAENRLAKTESALKEEKENVAAEIAACNDEAEAIENQIATLKTDAAKALAAAERDVEAAQQELEETKRKCKQEHDTANRCLISALEILTSHKTYVQERIGEVEAKALNVHRAIKAE